MQEVEKESHNSKRLAKNTLVLYLRMLITVGISLYTSRVILANLGVSDYGLYNVIGGFVAMFYMITTTVSEAVSRFLTYGLGKGDIAKLKITFSTSINIMILLSLIIVLIGETVGLWFVNNKLVIESSRIAVANWLYQLSLFCLIIQILNIPYHASVISHERMKAFAVVTLIEVFLKLTIALALAISPIDRLLFYGVCMALVSMMRQTIYWGYCKEQFVECSYAFCFEKDLFREMFSFAGWSFFTSAAFLFKTQGVNIMLNLFFGTPINAARGIATHVNSTVQNFSDNFTFALSPQIIKTYAAGDKTYTTKLLFIGAKFSFFLLFVVSFPLLLETEFLLGLWLKEVPQYSVEFVQLALICTMAEVALRPFATLNAATGDVKLYKMVIGGAQLLILPIGYIVLKMGALPYSTEIVTFVIAILLFVPRILLNRKYIDITFLDFVKKVALRCVFVIIISYVVCQPIIMLLPQGYLRLLFVLLMSTSATIISIYTLGLEIEERKMVNECIKKVFNKFKR